MIHFNRPYMTGKETEYIRQAVQDGKISGNGEFTKRCQDYFEKRYGFRKCLLTTSCSDALEMAAILTDVGPGDEVIVPSYTFVSSALAFVRQGATLVFADSRADHPGIDEDAIESLVTPRTKVVVVVHYAGVACDMDKVMAVANRHDLLVVEDAAQAVDSFYIAGDGAPASKTGTPEDGAPASKTGTKKSQQVGRDVLGAPRKPLGSIGHLAAFSFHETKNIISGEGGLLVVNDERFVRRAEIIWEKGTNRAEFFRGEVNKYGWVDTGSSFLPTEIVSAFLWAQLEHLDEIQAERKRLWNRYLDFFTELKKSDPALDGLKLPVIPGYATNNAHMFYLLFPDLATRTEFIAQMKARDILTVFHYLPLHSSAFYRKYRETHRPMVDDATRRLPNCDRYADTLVRLPMYCGLAPDQEKVIAAARDVLAGIAAKNR
jgi:dTDP-4-amino-4,6-dideoxygalactose transaminase